MACIKYDVKLLSTTARKKLFRKELREGDIYLGTKGCYMAVIHCTPHTCTTINMSNGTVTHAGYKQMRVSKNRKPTLHLVGMLAKDSLKLIRR